MSNFKALLIDVDDTVLPEWDVAYPIWKEVCSAAATATGLSASTLSDVLKQTGQRVLDQSPFGEMARSNYYDAEALLWDTLDFHGPPVEGLDRWLAEFRTQVWSESLTSLNAPPETLIADFAHQMQLLGEARRVPYPESFGVLEYLSAKYTLVAVTNGVPGVQARKIERHGLDRYFNHVVLCNEHAPKPDPLPFQAAMKLAGVSPGECAMIGNSLSRDIKGARGVGIHSVWINRNGEVATPDTSPDIEIQTLEQLKSIF